jgi:hypothetical protein
MADAAAGLPVAYVPEEILISTMRDDVVDDSDRDCLASGLTAYAEGMLALVAEAGSIPSR